MSEFQQMYKFTLEALKQIRIQEFTRKAPISIEDNVLIAGGVVVSAGVTIVENSIIDADSFVVRDVKPNCFQAGNPSKK